MNEAIAFDTHRFVKRLTATGFTEAQAEALAEEQVTLLNANLATKADIARIGTDIAQVEAALKTDIAEVEAALKADIAQVEAALKADIAQVEASLKVDIAQAKHEITKWMVGIVLSVAAVQTTLIVGLLSWLLQGE